MSITSQSRRNNYTGTNALKVYDYTFKLFNAADLEVKVRLNSSGLETTLVLNTDYTVEFVNASTGGTITLLDAGQAWLTGGFLLSTYKISLRLSPALSQSTDIKNNTRYFPYLHERQFDKEFQILLKQQDELDRSIKLPSSIDPAEFNTNLPKDILIAGAGKFIKVKADATGLELGDSSVDLSDLANKEDRTAETIVANDSEEVLTVDSARRIIVTGALGKYCDLLLPPVTDMVKGRSFLLENQSDAYQSFYTSDYNDFVWGAYPGETILVYCNNIVDNVFQSWTHVQQFQPEYIVSSSDYWGQNTDYTFPTDDLSKTMVYIANSAGININLRSRFNSPGGAQAVVYNAVNYTHMIQFPESGTQWLIRPGEVMRFLNDPTVGWVHIGVSQETSGPLNAGTKYQRFTKVLIDVDDFTTGPAYGLECLRPSTFSDDMRLNNLTANTVTYLDASKIMQSSAVTPTQLGFLDATSSIQTQLDNLFASVITFPLSDTTFQLKGNVDATRKSRFNVGNRTTGTDNTHTLPADSGDLAQLASNVGANNPVFNLTSGSVTYDAGAGNRREFTSVIKSNAGWLVTSTVSIKLSAISTPVNTALSIPMSVPPSSTVLGFKPSAAVRCNNCTLTGQLFVHVEYGSSDYKFTIVNNGVETAVSAATFLQATSELHFTISYYADN